MKLKDVMQTVRGELLTNISWEEREVQCAFCSDLMSDVLAFVEGEAVLVTGLVNQQVIRTAEMLDISAILFVRGKKPCDDVISLAHKKNIVLFATGLTMFESAAVLYNAGLCGVKL